MTHPVGEKQPNSFGLYDMSGNVWEITCSAYDESYSSSEMKCAKSKPKTMVQRGGSWRHGLLRSADREPDPYGMASFIIGFRLAQD